MKHEARSEARASKTEVRRQHKLERRRQRRGLLRAFGTLGVFFAIVGGAALMLPPTSVSIATATDVVGMSSRHPSTGRAHAAAAGSVAVTDEGARAWTFHSSTEQALAALGDGARVLVALEPSAAPSVRSAGHAVAAGLKGLGLRPVGITEDPSAQMSDEDIDLLSDALYEASLASAGPGELAGNLKALAARRGDVDAILWLKADDATGHIRIQLHSGAAGMGPVDFLDAREWPGGDRDATDATGCPDGDGLEESACDGVETNGLEWPEEASDAGARSGRRSTGVTSSVVLHGRN